MMDSVQLHRRFSLAKEVAAAASDFLLSHESLRSEVRSKAVNDYVTLADSRTEELIRSLIRSSFPEDGILGEEYGDASGRGGRWIVDPVDGTVDFMASFPCYTVSIAFEDEEGLAFGVIAVPRQGEVFSAFRGEGAFLGDRAIHTDEDGDISRSLAILVPPHRHHELLDAYMAKMRRFYDIVSDMRSLGSAALSLCYVACGRASIYYEMALHIYDAAAGIIILREAGGRVTLLSDDENWIDIAASSAAAHDAMLGVVNDQSCSF